MKHLFIACLLLIGLSSCKNDVETTQDNTEETVVDSIPTIMYSINKIMKYDNTVALVFYSFPLFLIICTISLSILYKLLKAEKKEDRYIQIASNYLGIVCIYLFTRNVASLWQGTNIILLLLLIWFFSTLTYIMKNSFEKPVLHGFSLVLLIYLAPFIVVPFYYGSMISWMKS